MVSEEHGSYDQSLTFTSVEPPEHECQEHGRHPRWITLYGYGERCPKYCMDCVVGLLERERVGKVYVAG